MGRAGADDERVLEAARRVLAQHRIVKTQRRMGRLVRQALGGDVAVTDARVRRLAATADFCRVDVQAREGPREKVLNACPVCRGRLDRVKNQTLFGGEVTLTLRCPACGYWTGKSKRIPTLYVFHQRA